MADEKIGTAGWMFVSFFKSRDTQGIPGAFITYDFTGDNLTNIVGDMRNHIKDQKPWAITIKYPAWFKGVEEKVTIIKSSLKIDTHCDIHLIANRAPLVDSPMM